MKKAASESVASRISPPARSLRLPQGFTLIELLVVVGIIALLAGVLLPSLVKAKARARLVQCINNQRQLSLTWLMYAGDNNDALVADGVPVQGGTIQDKFWVQGLFFYHFDATNRNLILNPGYALFAPYLKTIDVYRCPADRSGVKIGPGSYSKVRSYALNCYLGWTGLMDSLEAPTPNYKIFEKTTALDSPAPSVLFTFIDVHPSSICRPYFGVEMGAPGTEAFINYPATYHEGKGVVGFADGHAETHQWLDPRTLAANSPDFHRHDDPSPQNMDLDWLRDRATTAGQ